MCDSFGYQLIELSPSTSVKLSEWSFLVTISFTFEIELRVYLWLCRFGKFIWLTRFTVSIEVWYLVLVVSSVCYGAGYSNWFIICGERLRFLFIFWIDFGIDPLLVIGDGLADLSDLDGFWADLFQLLLLCSSWKLFPKLLKYSLSSETWGLCAACLLNNYYCSDSSYWSSWSCWVVL